MASRARCLGAADPVGVLGNDLEAALSSQTTKIVPSKKERR
ncbi:MAG TPA: hypothetical protein VFP40_12490 [Terriglobales bacterium]|jgi:hypothetical protein|nr:hypothetical protein [Terriglobales bacterium]